MVVGFPLLSILCEIKLDNGWPWAFYIPGTIGVVWFCLWSFLISESPENHRYISEKERAYIMGSTGRKADATNSVYINNANIFNLGNSRDHDEYFSQS